MYIPYSGKFSRVLIFAVFVDCGVSAKLKHTNFFNLSISVCLRY